MKLKSWALILIGVFGARQATATVTLPYTFSSGQTIKASEVNANDGALRDEINTHTAAVNPHSTDLEDVLNVSNTVGSASINFNLSQGYSFRVENLSADPTCNSANKGRLIWNTTDALYKVCNGTSFVSIAGTGVNTLASVLTAGNSAGSSNLDMNFNQLIQMRVENLTSNPSAGYAGRMYLNRSTSTLMLDNGASIGAIGGAQTISSVVDTGATLGSTSIDFNGTQGVNLRLENRASDPGTTTAGRIYYNTGTSRAKIYNGSSFVNVGDQNTLAQVLSNGASAGSTDLDMNGQQLKNVRIENETVDPGTGPAGTMWFNTSDTAMRWATGSAIKTACTLDDAQTLTNKTISGSSNTITNIQDSSLTSNVVLKDSAQTITGAKTFSSYPTMNAIKTTSGAQHSITDGLSNDTFTLNSAVQTLTGKTLNGFTLSGTADFNNYQIGEFRLENLSANPSYGNSGRLFYKTTTGELLYDTGTEWRVLTSNSTSSYTWAAILGNGASAGSVNPDFNDNQALNMRLENLGADPSSSASKSGRIFWSTATSQAKVDTGSSIMVLTGNAISNLTGDVTADGPGVVAATVVSVGGQTAANVATATTTVNTAQSGNKFLASPAHGGSAAPAFRAMVDADLPIVSAAHGGLSVSMAGSTGVLHVNNGTAFAGPVQLASEASGILPTANGGTGVNSSSSSGIAKWASGAVTFGQVNLNNTIDATGILPAAQGGLSVSMSGSTGVLHMVSGVAVATPVQLAGSNAVGVLPVSKGGTGLTSAGTSGNVLTSDGTNWVSSTPLTSGLSVSGSSGNYTIPIANDYFTATIPSAAASILLTLPAASSGSGHIHHIKGLSIGVGVSVAIAPNGTDTIESFGNRYYLTSNDEAVQLVSDGVSKWRSIANHGREVAALYVNNGGEVVSASVDITFNTKVFDTHNAFNGTKFTAPMDGIYFMSGKFLTTTNSGQEPTCMKNGVTVYTGVSDYATATRHHFACMYTLIKGDTISIRADTGCTLSASATQHFIAIQKVGN